MLSSALMAWCFNEKNAAAKERKAELRHKTAAMREMNALVEKQGSDLETVRGGAWALGVREKEDAFLPCSFVIAERRDDTRLGAYI